MEDIYGVASDMRSRGYPAASNDATERSRRRRAVGGRGKVDLWLGSKRGAEGPPQCPITMASADYGAGAGARETTGESTYI